MKGHDLLKLIYGLDFGTSNTHLSSCTANDLFPLVDDIKIYKDNSIPSAILYDEKTFTPVTFGKKAIEEWFSMSKSEKRKFRLSTDFKQRMAFNKRSQAEAEMFLSSLFEYLINQKLINSLADSESIKLVTGIPSQTVSDHSEKLSSVLNSCTGIKPVLTEEPLGALFFHIMKKDINKNQARSGVLVIDFGGGTLDFAYLKNFKVHAKWGSPFIGGNLFDDLFYSEFLRQNPNSEKEIKSQGLQGYLRTVVFKELKEKYSFLLSDNKDFNFTEPIFVNTDFLGNFSIPSKELFTDRMCNYTPSSEYTDDMNSVEGFAEIFLNKPTNLVKLIKDCMKDGLEKNNIKSDSVSLIILTGGSSRWSFFMDMVKEIFPFTEIISSSDPESTISRGLGLAYSSSVYEMKVRKELRENKPELLSEFRHIYNSVIDDNISKLSANLYDLYEPLISRNISSFFRTGGKIEDLEKSIKRDSQLLEPQIAVLKNGFIKIIESSMDKAVKKALSKWFNRSGIVFDFTGDTGVDFEKENANQEIHTIDSIFYDRITAISSLIIGIIIGNIMGGSGMALLAAGPLGWLAGFIGGLIITIASMLGFKNKLKTNFKSMKIPGFMLKLFLINEGRIIKNSRKNLVKSLEESSEKTKEKLGHSFKDIEKKLNEIIDEQIEEISYSNFVDF